MAEPFSVQRASASTGCAGDFGPCRRSCEKDWTASSRRWQAPLPLTPRDDIGNCIRAAEAVKGRSAA